MELLMKLLDTYGASGAEESVRDIIIKEIKPYVSEIKVDTLGNLIAMQKGSNPKVMVAAHMDEIGLMIKNIDKKGKIFFSGIGGLEPLVIIGQKVHITTKKRGIHGVITTDKMSKGEETEELPKLEDLYVDTGLSSYELKKLDIDIGTYLFLEQNAGELGSPDFISGKALDDRIGCYILIELAKRLKKTKYQNYFVFTAQEEVGLYGAKTSAYKIEPDWAVAVDATDAEDMDENPIKRLGRGPCITIKDSDMISNKCINNWLKDISKKKRIPIQLDVSDSGTTDAISISISRSGVPSTVIGIPVRNIHSTIGIVHKKDIENAIKLLEELLKNPPKVCITR